MIKLVFVSFIGTILFAFAEKHDIEYSKVAETQTTELSESIDRGKIIYDEFCVRCHKETGQGHPKFYPPLAGSDWLTEKRTESIHSVKYGLKGAIVVNGVTFKRNMSSPGLEDSEIADVMNYIMNSWGNTQTEMVTEEEVASLKE